MKWEEARSLVRKIHESSGGLDVTDHGGRCGQDIPALNSDEDLFYDSARTQKCFIYKTLDLDIIMPLQ